MLSQTTLVENYVKSKLSYMFIEYKDILFTKFLWLIGFTRQILWVFWGKISKNRGTFSEKVYAIFLRWKTTLIHYHWGESLSEGDVWDFLNEWWGCVRKARSRFRGLFAEFNWHHLRTWQWKASIGNLCRAFFRQGELFDKTFPLSLDIRLFRSSKIGQLVHREVREQLPNGGSRFGRPLLTSNEDL